MRKALVLFSGGQDSAVCLVHALQNFDHVETVGFDYRQRHRVELDERKEFLSILKDIMPNHSYKLHQDHILDLGIIGEMSRNALTTNTDIATQENGLPNTFVPGRNIMFFTFAAALAYQRDLKHLVGGMCETDYSGYPDCRDDSLKALQITLNLGMNTKFTIHTPLMWLDKAHTWQMADDIGGKSFVELIIHKTHTCYKGDHKTFHEWGYGCNDCPACHLRSNGWYQYKSIEKKNY
jgi:7-cyano-7-deazaguanine synthase